MIDLRQTKEYAYYMKSIGWIVEGKPGAFAYIKRFPLIGSFVKIQRPYKLNSKEMEVIRQLGKKYRAFQIVIEPVSTTHIPLLTKHGFRLTRSYFVPSKTVHIDLAKSQKQLLSGMHHKTRYNIKKTSNNSQLTTHNSKNIQSFADFWQKCAQIQRGMFLSQKKEIIAIYEAFGGNAKIINVKNKNGQKLSAILLIKAGKFAYYMYAASTSKGKKLFAPTLNAWEAIKLAKKLGCKFFDFEGIYDERFPIKTWLGFTRFKISFGGKEIEYPGTFKKFLLPF